MIKKILCLLLVLTCNIGRAQIYVPNAFTPDSNGINDVFQVVILDTLTFYELQVYNASGGLIFRTNEVYESWQGGFEYYNNINAYPYKIIYKRREDPVYQIIYGCVSVIK